MRGRAVAKRNRVQVCLGAVSAVLFLTACDPARVSLMQTGASDPGRGLLNSSVPESRIAYYSSAIKRNPRDASALKGLGVEYSRLSRWRDSAGAYREALIINPRDADALIGMGRAQLAVGDANGAFANGEAALAIHRSLDALMLTGVALNYVGRTQEALAIYEEALSNNPRDLDLRNNIALSMALAGDARAYPTMEAVAYAPDSDGRHKRNLILVAAILGRAPDAQAQARQFGIGKNELDEIFKIAGKMRMDGAIAAGLATAI